jgi:hypothetical protein
VSGEECHHTALTHLPKHDIMQGVAMQEMHSPVNEDSSLLRGRLRGVACAIGASTAASGWCPATADAHWGPNVHA